MRGTILGPTECAIGGVVLPRGGETAPALVWSVAGSTQVDEGDPGAYTVSYTGATLAPGQTATISVATATGGLTWPDATAGSDYTALSAVLTFSAGGATEKTVAVPTIDDTEVEGTEDFRVTIGGASVGTPGTSEANTTIASEDNGDLLLDLVPGAVQAYSMRKLRAAYAGNCIRLRRSSDNAEADFGFDGAGDLDIAAISGWLGGATGHVVTWYDQSGNGFNATQGISSNQPVYGAALVNSLPAIDFVSDDRLGMSRPTPSSTWTTLSVLQKDTTSSGMVIADNTQNRQHAINPSGASTMRLYAGTVFDLSYVGDVTDPHLYGWENRGSNVGEMWVDGVSLGTGNPGAGTLACDEIGRLTAGSAGFDGKIGEIIVFNPNLSGDDRVVAEADITDHWEL